jgi:hypothetical protein
MGSREADTDRTILKPCLFRRGINISRFKLSFFSSGDPFSRPLACGSSGHPSFAVNAHQLGGLINRKALWGRNHLQGLGCGGGRWKVTISANIPQNFWTSHIRRVKAHPGTKAVEE